MPAAARVITNARIADQLDQLAELLRHQKANRFKIKAYQRAADAVRTNPQPISELIAAGSKLTRIPGVGAGISAAIEEIVASGSLASAQRLAADLPPGTLDIAQAARIPIRDAQRLVAKLQVATVDDLRARLASGGIAEAMGSRLEYKVRAGLLDARRLLWWDAEGIVLGLTDWLSTIPGVDRVEPAGSFRRRQETVGTLRFVVQTTDARAARSLRNALARHGGIEDLRDDADSSYSARLSAGPLLRVRCCTAASWGAALAEETGSPEHLEHIAQRPHKPRKGPSATEEEWYAAHGLPFIPPELREGRGEVAAALAGELPSLVELDDIRGDLHCHTTASDGANTIEEMAAAARARGYSYLAITDHSKSLKITRGLTEERLRAQGAAIDAVNASLRGFRVLKGSEVDILEDGSLDFDDATLATLDLVIASIHSRFGLDQPRQTQRIIRAMENPYLTCLGHLTGRLLLKRPGYDLDLDRVFKAVKKHGKWLEINSSPDRLDIDDALAFKAQQMGIPILINTDAHSIRELDFMRLGVQQARRGWRTAETVVNTLPLPALLKRLKQTRTRARPARLA